jgi:TatD DNase family protein
MTEKLTVQVRKLTQQTQTPMSKFPKAQRPLPIIPITSSSPGETIPLIDIGANLSGKYFRPNHVPNLLQRASGAGISHIILTGTSYSESVEVLETCATYDGSNSITLRCTVGIHPHKATSIMTGAERDTFDADLENLIVSEKGKKYCVAVGECGLDYDRKFSLHEHQQQVFEKQLQLAKKLGKPVFLHNRDAHDDFLTILKPYLADIKAVAHCHTDPSVEHLKQLLDAGVYIGLTGMICDEREGRFNTEIIKHIPLERMMVETDSPFLFPRNVPKPWGKHNNEPCLTRFVVQKIVEVRGDCDEEIVARTTTEVAKAFFGL